MAQSSSFCEGSLNEPGSFSADDFYGFERYLFWHRINLINDENRLSGLISNLWTNYGNVAPHAAIIHMYYLIFGEFIIIRSWRARLYIYFTLLKFKHFQNFKIS